MIIKILQKLDCMPQYSAVVLKEPIQVKGNFLYTIKVDTKTYRIFGIKIYTVKL